MFISIVRWLKSLCRSEATEQEVQDYIARLERAVDELTIEFDYREYLVKQEAERQEAEREDQERERENTEYWSARQKEIEEENLAREEQERRNREEEDEQQHYRSYCPHCGSQYRLGRCPACDEAFGRN